MSVASVSVHWPTRKSRAQQAPLGGPERTDRTTVVRTRTDRAACRQLREVTSRLITFRYLSTGENEVNIEWVGHTTIPTEHMVHRQMYS